MTISTYTELKTAIAAWVKRGDLTAVIPDFIRLAESRLNRRLRLRNMVTAEAVVSVVDSRNIALPTGFLEQIGLWIDNTDGQDALRYISITELPVFDTSGEPEYWTIEGANIAFERPSDQVYNMTLRMYKAFNLSDAAPTNWLLTNYPDVYLYASLLEAAPYLKDSGMAATWREFLTAAISELVDADARSKAMTTLSSDVALSAKKSSILTDR